MTPPDRSGHPTPGDSSRLGFNSDVTHRTRTYHVQTEYLGGDGRAAISSLVYRHGALVRKIVAAAPLRSQASDDQIEVLVRRQHAEVLGSVKRGELERG